MKKCLSIMGFLCCISASGCYGQGVANFSIRVTDDDGLAVSNANVGVGYETRSGTKNFYGTTDTNGVYHYHGEFGREVGWFVRKAGYYDTSKIEMFFTGVAFGRLQPWGKQHDVTLRQIVNPIAMYEGVMAAKVPELNKPFGFDLMKADMVTPFGKGEVADLIVKMESSDAKVPPGYYEKYPQIKKRKNEKLTVSFSKPDDGIQIFYYPTRRSGGSVFRSPRYAPETGYATNFVSICCEDEGNRHDDRGREDQNYIFRVRTVRDEHGVITNAFYGKIYGPFNYNAPFATCTYYLNPTSLDRNLEFDRTKNLLQGVVDQRQLPSEP
jgi:hypothetical protein